MTHLFLGRLVVPVILLPLVLIGLRYRSSMSRSRRYAWMGLVVTILIGESALIVNTMRHNIALVPEWDFLGFWLNAHVAAAHHNFYDPRLAQALASGLPTSAEFRREILDVGFWYPPPSIFVFLPLAAFSNVHVAYLAWYVLQTTALVVSAVVLGRRFIEDLKWIEAAAVVGALIVLMPATLSTVSYGQTSFLALMFTALFWSTRNRARGGFWLVAAALTKPFLGALALALLCRGKWRALIGTVVSAVALCALTILGFGSKTFFSYFQARPDAHIPAWVFLENTNQSLLGFILRLSHQPVADHVPLASLLLFALVAFVMTGVTVWLCLRAGDSDSDIAFGLTLSLALLVYPSSQSFYAVLLIVPALILLKRCETTQGGYAQTIVGIVVAYACMASGFTIFAYLLCWLTFAVLAMPARIRVTLGEATSFTMRSVAGIAKSDQSAPSSAIGLTVFFVALIAVIAAHDIARPGKSMLAGAGTDFRAFYCSGVAVNRGASPYVVEPLRACEHAVQPAKGWSDDLVVPAPLPGYDVAFFATLARVPYPAAKTAWLVFSFGCLFVSAWLLARLTRLPPGLILLGLSLVDGIEPVSYGQLPPLAVVALCAAAYFSERRRYSLAAATAAVAMIEPHLGLPACLAMFIWLPRTRLPFAGVAAFLAAVSVLATGLVGNLAYFLRYLPEQAAAELAASDQFALSHQLHLLGLSDPVALRVGFVSYALMVVLGVLLARRTAVALASPALIVVLPVAAALLGGSFVHDIQFAAALPCAFILTARAKVARLTAQLGLLLLIFPWYSLGRHWGWGIIPAAVAALATSIWLNYLVQPEPRPQRRLALAATAVCLFVSLLVVFTHLPKAAAPKTTAIALPPAVLAPSASASSNWAAFIRSTSLGVSSPRKELAKVPTWFGIVLLLIAAGAQRRQRTSITIPAEMPAFEIRTPVGAALSLGTNRGS